MNGKAQDTGARQHRVKILIKMSKFLLYFLLIILTGCIGDSRREAYLKAQKERLECISIIRKIEFIGEIASHKSISSKNRKEYLVTLKDVHIDSEIDLPWPKPCANYFSYKVENNTILIRIARIEFISTPHIGDGDFVIKKIGEPNLIVYEGRNGEFIKSIALFDY